MRRSGYVPTTLRVKKIKKLTFPKSKKSQEFQKKSAVYADSEGPGG